MQNISLKTFNSLLRTFLHKLGNLQGARKKHGLYALFTGYWHVAQYSCVCCCLCRLQSAKSFSGKSEQKCVKLFCMADNFGSWQTLFSISICISTISVSISVSFLFCLFTVFDCCLFWGEAIALNWRLFK